MGQLALQKKKQQHIKFSLLVAVERIKYKGSIVYFRYQPHEASAVMLTIL